MSRQTHAALLTAMLLITAIAWGCLADVNAGSLSGPRHSKWPAVRNAYLKDHPECAACGRTGRGLQVHHVLPVNAFGNEDDDGDGIINELDEDVFITLCVDGPGGMSCHFVIGHSARGWNFYNPNARRDAERFRAMMLKALPNTPKKEIDDGR